MVTTRCKNFFKHHPHAKEWAYIVCGCMLYSISLNVFLAGNQIAAGGLGGIATVLNQIFSLKISFLLLILNIPLVILGLLIKVSQTACSVVK